MNGWGAHPSTRSGPDDDVEEPELSISQAIAALSTEELIALRDALDGASGGAHRAPGFAVANTLREIGFA